MKAARHILLIEDDYAIREAVTEILKLEGFEVACAANGADALAQLSDPAQHFGLILLDLMMPVMDGWSFRRAQASRPELASIPVVVLSASAIHDGSVNDLSVAAVLAKPFELQQLLDTVQQHCLAA